MKTKLLTHALEYRIRALELFDRDHPDLLTSLGTIRAVTYSDLHYSLCRTYLWSGDRDLAKTALVQSIRWSPSATKRAALAALALPGQPQCQHRYVQPSAQPFLHGGSYR